MRGHEGREGDFDGIKIGRQTEKAERAAIVGERALELAVLPVKEDDGGAHLRDTGGVRNEAGDGARRAEDGLAAWRRAGAGKADCPCQVPAKLPFCASLRASQHQTTLNRRGNPRLSLGYRKLGRRGEHLFTEFVSNFHAQRVLSR